MLRLVPEDRVLGLVDNLHEVDGVRANKGKPAAELHTSQSKIDVTVCNPFCRLRTDTYCKDESTRIVYDK